MLHIAVSQPAIVLDISTLNACRQLFRFSFILTSDLSLYSLWERRKFFVASHPQTSKIDCGKLARSTYPTKKTIVHNHLTLPTDFYIAQTFYRSISILSMHTSNHATNELVFRLVVVNTSNACNELSHEF